MSALVAALWLTLAPLQDVPPDPAPLPTGAGGAWMLLQHFYPGPTPGRGVDYWISVDDYGPGPNAEGIVRVRVISPGGFNADLQPTRFIDSVRDVDCVNRRERTIIDGTPDEWATLPDFVPGARMIFGLCDPAWMSRREHRSDFAAALAYSQELERLHRTKGPHPVY